MKDENWVNISNAILKGRGSDPCISLNFTEKDALGVFLISAVMLSICILRRVLLSTKGNSLVGMDRAGIMTINFMASGFLPWDESIGC